MNSVNLIKIVNLMFSGLSFTILNFSLAAKVLIYIIKIITPPKNTKTIK